MVLITCALQELTEFPIMCIGAETEVKRYVPPRKGTLTLIITDGFTLKVLWIVCVLTVLLRGVLWLRCCRWDRDFVYHPLLRTKCSVRAYMPLTHSILWLQDTYRVLSAADREYINEIARQSGDLLTMTTYGVQNYKLRFHEGG
jgi:hypothetical protein